MSKRRALVHVTGSALFVALVFPGAALAQEKPPEPPLANPSGDGLRGILDKSVDDLVKDLSGKDTDRAVAEGELSKRGILAVKPLVSCVVSPDAKLEARLAAARIVRKIADEGRAKNKPIDDPAAQDAFLAVFKDTKASLDLRGEAARALGDLHATQTTKDLIAGLADNWLKISESSRAALATMGEPVVDEVIKAYETEMAAKDGKDGIIYRSIMILGDVGGDKARATLAQALKQDKGPRALGLRFHAAIALGLTGDKFAIQIVLDAYDAEKDARVANALERSLEWLTNEHEVAPQPFRWKAWWSSHKDVILTGEAKYDYEKILLPKKGIDAPPDKPKSDPPK
ncbi:HEAT repeat domain-containing protein [bacterium]|nr:HEAT repeat domain-containing protein [bacterium]